MRVLIVTAGSLGDVAPYTGLGARLRAAGHRVALAAPAPYADLVTGAGLEFRPVLGDLSALRTGVPSRRRPGVPGAPGLVEFVRLGTRFVDGLGESIVTAAGAGTDILLLSASTAPLGYSVAQWLGVPSLGVYLQPVEPTRAFPPIVLGVRTLGGWGNLAAGRLGHRLGRRVYAHASRRLRSRLGLPPCDLAALDRDAAARSWPVSHGFSPTVLPRPPDWRPGLDVVGYWWPAPPVDWRPSPALRAFLAAGEAPVYVGFGSLADPGGRLYAMVRRALRRAGVRAVVQGAGVEAAPAPEVAGPRPNDGPGPNEGPRPDEGIRPDEGPGPDDDDQVLRIGEVPHEWLFPRMAALVHHGGCGTAGAGLRAGVPAVPVPMLADQPFWAARLARLGVSPDVIPFRRLNEARLGEAIRAAVTDPVFGARARLLAAGMTAEDGAAMVVAAVDRLAR